MNSIVPGHPIRSYEDLQLERQRLEVLIQHQKNRIRQDLEDLREEIKTEIRPALEAAREIKKFTHKDTRNQTLMTTGTAAVIDLLLRRAFNKSNFIVQLIVPGLIKNYTSHVMGNLVKKMTKRPAAPLDAAHYQDV